MTQEKEKKLKADQLQKVFGTTDIMKILELVMEKGEVQLTTDQRRKKIEDKRKQIIAILLRETIDKNKCTTYTNSD